MLFSIIIKFNRLGAAILFHMYKLNKFKVTPSETITEGDGSDSTQQAMGDDGATGRSSGRVENSIGHARWNCTDENVHRVCSSGSSLGRMMHHRIWRPHIENTESIHRRRHAKFSFSHARNHIAVRPSSPRHTHTLPRRLLGWWKFQYHAVLPPDDDTGNEEWEWARKLGNGKI